MEIAAVGADWMAGAEGFEPSNAGIKIRCLTTWRRPNRAGTILAGGTAFNAASATIPPLERRNP